MTIVVPWFILHQCEDTFIQICRTPNSNGSWRKPALWEHGSPDRRRRSSQDDATDEQKDQKNYNYKYPRCRNRLVAFVYMTLTIWFQNSLRCWEGGGVSCISPDFARRVTQKMKAGRIESGELAELVLTQQATKLTEYTSILELFIIHDCTRTDSLRMTQTQEKTHNPLFYSPLIACGAWRLFPLLSPKRLRRLKTFPLKICFFLLSPKNTSFLLLSPKGGDPTEYGPPPLG